MPSSRRTPRRRKRLRADMESAPTVNGRVCDQPGNRNLVAPKTHVGDDACIVPGSLLHRKVPGRDKSLPYKPSEHDSPNRDGRNHPGVRRAGCPHPAEARGGTNVSILNRQCAAGVNARPTERGKCGGQPGNRGPALQQTSVGDDACIVPGTLLHRKVPGRDKSRPYKPSEMTGQTGRP